MKSSQKKKIVNLKLKGKCSAGRLEINGGHHMKRKHQKGHISAEQLYQTNRT
jgi:hypothetical protein